MNLELSPIDYTVVGLTLSNTLKLLPIGGPKPSLKVSVGDQDGVLQLFSVKNEELQLAFKTLPGEPITSLHLGGSTQGSLADKIFVSSGSEVKGYNKKGKLFLALETNLAEPIIAMLRIIKSINIQIKQFELLLLCRHRLDVGLESFLYWWVQESDLIVAGAHCVTHFKDCKEVGSYLCGDTIVDLAAIQIPNSSRIVAIIACSGGAVRAIERGRALGGSRLPQGPRVLCCLPEGVKPYLLCGADDGTLHLLQLDREHGGIVSQQFDGVNSGDGITSLGWWEGSNAGGGQPLLLLARSDGSINIYNMLPDDPQQTALLLFIYKSGESITSLCGNSLGVVASTRAGRVFGLGPPMQQTNSASKLLTLRNDVLELELKVEKERAKYRTATQPLSQGLSAIPALQIGEEWGPVENDGARRLCISLGAPLDTLLIQSPAQLYLADTPSNTALLTKAQNSQDFQGLLATYRCQANTQRLEMRVGTTFEGLSGCGELRIYVTPLLQPKCTQLLIYQVPPLSWHVPTQDIENMQDFNRLSVRGAFSKAELHSSLVRLLPEVPIRPPPNMETLSYRSIITDTTLIINYQKGEADFKSDNVSTIAIIKDFLSLEAMKKKLRLDITCNVNDDTIIKTILKLHPKVLESYQRAKDEKLLKALRELEIDSTTARIEDQLCVDYITLLKQSPSTNKENKSLTLQQLYDIIVNLYIDRNRLKGINIKNKLPEIRSLLDNYVLDNLLLFFTNSFAVSATL